MLAEFQDFLDDISHCFIHRDFPRWRSRLLLPFSLISRDGPSILDTEAAVEENFKNYLKAADAMELTYVDRRIITLEDCKDGTWLGTFETRLVSHATLATAPYTATVLLHPTLQFFRMSSMLNGRGHREWTDRDRS